MALTRRALKAMGIEDEKIDQIIEAHSETVDGLKEELQKAKEKADRLDAVQKELNTLKEEGGSYKDKYEKERAEFEKYKSEVTAKETKAAKETAVRKYFESKGITGKNLDIAMRGCRDEISAVSIKDDKISDTKALDDLIAGDYAGLIVKKEQQGAETATPPSNNGGGTMTRAEIMKIKNTAERQKAIAENINLFK